MKHWKTECSRALRRANEELPSGAYYKRKHDVWDSPSDGKCYLVGWNDKGMRK